MENSQTLLPTDASEFIPAISNPASIPLIEDDELVDLLAQASESELNGIVEILTKKGRLTCSLTNLDSYKQRYPNIARIHEISRPRFNDLVPIRSPLTYSDQVAALNMRR